MFLFCWLHTQHDAKCTVPTLRSACVAPLKFLLVPHAHFRRFHLFLRPAVLKHNLALKTAALAVAAGFPLASDTGTLRSDTGSVLKRAAVLLTATPPDAPVHHQLQSLVDSVQRTQTLVQHAVCSAHRNILNMIADFASALATEQRDTECAQQASEHHLLVMCPNWGTSRVDIPQVERRKRKGANRLVERVFTRHNICTYFYLEHQQDVCCRRDDGVFMCIAAVLGGAGCVVALSPSLRLAKTILCLAAVADDVPVARPILFTSHSWYSWSG